MLSESKGLLFIDGAPHQFPEIKITKEFSTRRLSSQTRAFQMGTLLMVSQMILHLPHEDHQSILIEMLSCYTTGIPIGIVQQLLSIAELC